MHETFLDIENKNLIKYMKNFPCWNGFTLHNRNCLIHITTVYPFYASKFTVQQQIKINSQRACIARVSFAFYIFSTKKNGINFYVESLFDFE